METLKVINEISVIIEVKIKKLKSLKSLNKNILRGEFDKYYEAELNQINDLRILIDCFKEQINDK